MSNGNNVKIPYSNTEIKKSLLDVFEKILNPSTKEKGLSLYKKIIKDSLYSENTMLFIIQQLSELFSLKNQRDIKEKSSYLILLPFIFSINDSGMNKSIVCRYISPILSIIQNLISYSAQNLFLPLIKTFEDIIRITLPCDNISTFNDMDIEEKRAYEIIQGFCFYNMNQKDNSNQFCGSQFILKLIENCPIVILPNYIKVIWGNLMSFLENPDYNAKNEILNCLISLVHAAEDSFTNFVNPTLYKVFSFLTDDDWKKRKLTLNLVYSVIHYNKDEILPLKENLISFLDLLKNDKVKEVRDVCILILDILNGKKEDEDVVQIKVDKNKNKVNNKQIKQKVNEDKQRNNSDYAISPNITPKKVKSKEDAHQRIKSKDYPPIQNKKQKINKRNINDDIVLKSSDNIETTIISKEKGKRPVTPTREIQRKSSSNVNNQNNEKEGENENMISKKNLKQNIINRKEDNSFINEKMVIKPNPNLSIFKMKKNQDFFKNAKNQKDIIIIESKTQKKNTEELNNIEEKNINQIPMKDTNNINYDYEPHRELKKRDDYYNNMTGEFNQEDFIIQSPNDNDNDNFNENYNEYNITKQEDYISSIEIKEKKTEVKIPEENNNIYKAKKKITNDDTTNQHINNNNNNELLITTLLTQMKTLSSNQISLVDSLSKIQIETNEQICNLNKKIEDLTKQCNYFSNVLSKIKNNPNSRQHKNQLSTSNEPKEPKDINQIFEDILTSNNIKDLIKLISKLSNKILGSVYIDYIEEALSRLSAEIIEGNYIPVIIPFFKIILLSMKIPINANLIEQIKEALSSVINNKEKNKISQENIVDITILLCNINS